MTVTDISTADGATIDSLYTRSRRSNDRVSSFQWPIQNNPLSKTWSLWKRALQYLQYKGKLITPLGKWKTRPHQRWSQEEELRVHSLQQSFLHGVNASAYFRHLVGPIQTPSEEDLLEIATNLLSGQLLVCSDGSFYSHSGTGSHTWVFATAASQILLQGAGPIYCHPKQLSSYQPELGGMITYLLFLLTVIAQSSDLESGQVTLYCCNNKSALENLFEPIQKRGIYLLLAVDCDLLVLVKDMLQALPIKVTWGWVKGHYQDDDWRIQHGPNDLVDTLATMFREAPPEGYDPLSKPHFHRLLRAPCTRIVP